MAFRIKVPQRRKAFLSKSLSEFSGRGKSWAHSWQPAGAREGGGLNLAAGDKRYFHSGVCCLLCFCYPPHPRVDTFTPHRMFLPICFGEVGSLFQNENMSICLSFKQSVYMGWGSRWVCVTGNSRGNAGVPASFSGKTGLSSCCPCALD